jgi:hypothetical protein
MKSYGLEDLAVEKRKERLGEAVRKSGLISKRDKEVRDRIGSKNFNPNLLSECNMTSLSTRVELFVNEQQWKECTDKQFKQHLLTLITQVELSMQVTDESMKSGEYGLESIF